MEGRRQFKANQPGRRMDILIKYLITFGILLLILHATTCGSSEEALNSNVEIHDFLYDGHVYSFYPNYDSWNDVGQESVIPISRHSLYGDQKGFARHGGGGWGWGWDKGPKKQSKKKMKKELEKALKKKDKKNKKHFKIKLKGGGGWWVHSDPSKGHHHSHGWGWSDPWFQNDPWFWGF